MKKLSLRIRFTLAASLFLLISCTVLTLLTNYSANKMVDAVTLQPSSHIEDVNGSSMTEQPTDTLPAAESAQFFYEIFRKESVIAACIIILAGSVATYFMAGYVLKPIKSLSKEVKKRNIDNFAKPLSVPQSSDEIQDLTISFNQLLTELQHSFEIQKQFSADAAHELRTPLAVLQTKLDIFSLSVNPNEETRDFIAALQMQLERLTSLIEDLLWFSRDLPLDSVKPVQLLPLLHDVAAELSDMAEEKKIELRIHGSDCTVNGEERLLERVFYNLLENAVKYSPEETIVEISWKVQNHQTFVCIADHGEGIPPEYRKEIFEPFFRIDKSRSREVGGNGLGLAVCKKILERHHASISVIPNHPSGSVFQITFPS